MEKLTAFRILSVLLLVYLNAFIASYTLAVKPMRIIRILGYACVMLIHILADNFMYACLIFSLPVTSLFAQCVFYWSKNTFWRKFASENAYDFWVDVTYVATLGVYIFAYHFRVNSAEAYAVLLDYVVNMYLKDLLLDVYKDGSMMYISLICVAVQAIGIFYEGADDWLLQVVIVFVLLREALLGWYGHRITKIVMLTQMLIGFRLFQWLLRDATW